MSKKETYIWLGFIGGLLFSAIIITLVNIFHN
jgi:hypothetical protein